MRARNYGLFALAVAVLAVGAMAYGVPVQQIAFLGLFLACPLMMFFMMRGMGGMGGSRDGEDTNAMDQSRPHDHSRPVTALHPPVVPLATPRLG
jgi:hypothetical protein